MSIKQIYSVLDCDLNLVKTYCNCNAHIDTYTKSCISV